MAPVPIKYQWKTQRQTSNISCPLVIKSIVDHSDVVGASPVGAAPTTSGVPYIRINLC